MSSFTLIGGDVDDEEAAAAMAAVACLLDEEAAAAGGQPGGEPFGWRGTAKLVTQGLIPTRTPSLPRWGNIERLRRAGRGGGGIVGQ